MTRSHSPEFCQISLCHSAYPELFALVGATVPDLRNKKLTYGSSTPGQTSANGNVWLAIVTKNPADAGATNIRDIDIGISSTKPPEPEFRHMGNNIYVKNESFGGEEGSGSTRTSWHFWPLYGENSTSNFGIRYLMRALL